LVFCAPTTLETTFMTDVERQPIAMTHRQILVVLTGLMLGLFLAALDQTIVATALPTIVGEFGGLDHLSWVVTAYLLASTVTSPLYGKISDLYGRKVVFQTAICLFLAGSILCGLSQNMAQLIAFRAIQGLGAGGLIVMALTIIGDVVSPRERGRYQGYFGAVFALASIAGPLLGGWFVDNLTWRWVFYINLPLGLVALFVTGAVLNLPFHRREHRIDFLGAGLLVGGVGALLLVTVWGGREYEWDSPLILGLALVGVALVALFLWWEARTPEPILPLRLFRDRTFALTSAAGFVVGLAMFGGIIFLPLFMQIVVGASATNSGLLLLPMMAGIITTSVGSGRLISRTGRYKIYPVIGSLLATLALFLLSTMGVGTTLPVASVYMLILGAGLGLVMQVLVLAVQNSVQPRDLGVATSASTFFRSLGGSFGTSLFGAIFTSQVAANIARNLPGADLAGTDLTSSPGVIAQLPEAVRIGVIQAFADSTSTVFLAAVPFALAAFLVVLLLPELPLREQSHVGNVEGETGVGDATDGEGLIAQL
jgi:EmrB/QacA subfamily drug resistance transporter